MLDRRSGKSRAEMKSSKRFDNVISWLYFLFILFAAALIIHLFFIQVIDIKKYKVKAKKQRASQNFAVRGDIYDRNGIKLATDDVFYNVFARRADYDEDESSPEVIAKKLAPILKVSKEDLLKKLNSPDQIIAVKKDVDRNTAKQIAQLHLRAISLDKKNIEYAAKDKLEHIENTVKYQRTQKGKIIYDFTTDPVATAKNPKGQDVTLTIDAAIQHICEKELAKMVEEKKALRGTVIVMNPHNGEILAYAVYPTYDPNNYRAATPEQIKNFRELIKSLGGKSTIILSTHILSEVSLTCNRVCIIDHGQIIAVDDTDNLEHQTNVRLEIFAPNPERFIEAAAQLKEVGPVECEGQSQLPESEHPLLKFVVRDIRDRVGAHRALFSLAAAQGWEIYSLHDERVTLEDAFIRLINKHQEMGGKK